jgi:hypothetical protein
MILIQSGERFRAACLLSIGKNTHCKLNQQGLDTLPEKAPGFYNIPDQHY